jgi:hypothetical protein
MQNPNDGVLPPIRLPSSLLQAARAEAARRDETLSQVVRRALRAYVEAAPRQEVATQRPATKAAAMLAELDAVGAPDGDYRAAFSSGSKDRLRPGETWRSRLVSWVERESGRL